jgi:S1-C subfamily serine protease
VQSVVPGSPPDKAGLKPGDVVQRVDGQATNNREAISKALNAKSAGSTARVEVLRNNAKQTLTWKVGK